MLLRYKDTTTRRKTPTKGISIIFLKSWHDSVTNHFQCKISWTLELFDKGLDIGQWTDQFQDFAIFKMLEGRDACKFSFPCPFLSCPSFTVKMLVGH